MNEKIKKVCEIFNEFKPSVIIPNTGIHTLYTPPSDNPSTILPFENTFSNIRDFIMWFITDNSKSRKYVSKDADGITCKPTGLRSISDMYAIVKNYFDIAPEQFLKEIMLMQKEDLILIYRCGSIKKICIADTKRASMAIPYNYDGRKAIYDSYIDYNIDDLNTILE